MIPDIGLITPRRAEETGTNSNRIVEGACGSSIHFPSEAQSQVISRQRERREKGIGAAADPALTQAEAKSLPSSGLNL